MDDSEFERAIARLPDLSREWCRRHPEFVTDRRLNAKANAAHYDALAEGHAEHSSNYWKYVEGRLGVRRRQDEARGARRIPKPTEREIEAAKISFPDEWREDPKKALAEYLKNKAALKREGRMGGPSGPVV